MKKSAFTLFILCFLSGNFVYSSLSAQNTTPKIDSLLKLVATMKPDTNKANTLHEVSRAYLFDLHDHANMKKYADLELVLSQKLNYEKGIAYSLLNNGIYYWSVGEYNTALYHYKKSLKLMMNTGIRKGESSCYLNIGQVYVDQGKYKEGAEYLLKGTNLKKLLGDTRGVSTGYNNLGNVYQYQANYAEALKYHLMSLKIKEELKDNVGISMSYNNIGLVFNSQGKSDEALEYYKKAAAIQERMNDVGGLGNVYDNIGNIYNDKKNYTEGLKYQLKSLKVRSEVDDKQGMASSYNNIGNCYTLMGKYDKALPYAIKALATATQIGEKKGIANSYNGLGRIYEMQKDFKNALYNYEQALKTSRELNYKEGVLFATENLAAAYAGSKQFDLALKYRHSAHDLRDSLLNKDNFKQVTELNTKYETDKKEKEILLLTKDQILTEKTLKEQRILRWGLIGGISLLFIAIFTTYRRYRFKQQANIILEKQKQEIEQQNTLIIDSIDYAKNIQEIILPNQRKVQNLFPQSFILYKPKAVVSGDFYWMYKAGNKLICAITDCTGHGVPGAFMSLLGSNMLENVVQKNNVVQPSKILDALNKEVVTRLGNQSNDGDIKHGMDIAVISIDTTLNQLQYSGAHNPIYIARGSELIEIKADKMTIGFDSKQNSILYTNKTTDLKKGDMIYMFTDGFPDQIGGPRRKKFFYAPFRRLLSSISLLDPQVQLKKLNDAHAEWLDGRFEQTDDILIMGIRV
ncbi:MAG TPA: tetratricopeptide repeat protein [Bacteroidia bacterium]|nr:tetratricopeptide repeat protein [Bacteroidia bacterium]